MNKLFFLIISLAMIFSSQVYGQVVHDTTLLYNIDTKDGNEFLGHIMFRDSSALIFKTESYGYIMIREDNVKKIELINQNQIKEGKVWIENYQDSRYFFLPVRRPRSGLSRRFQYLLSKTNLISGQVLW